VWLRDVVGAVRDIVRPAGVERRRERVQMFTSDAEFALAATLATAVTGWSRGRLWFFSGTR